MRVSDPDRSRGLAVEAERGAQAYANSSEKGETYARFAKVPAAIDPGEAEHVARSIVSSRWKIKALTEVEGAGGYRPRPGRAPRLRGHR